jgi:CRISPR/Cas system Type II protein with McrA/HNH and RuvC-like nuclease domain
MNNQKEYVKRQTIRENLFNLNEHCVYCNCKLSVKNLDDPSFATIEHLTPKSENGTNFIENLALACKLCNSTLRSSRSSFIGIEFKDSNYKHSDKTLKLLTTLLVYKNQEVIIKNLIKYIKTDQLDKAFDFIKNEFDNFIRKSFLITIKNYITRIVKSIDSIILQVKYITEFLNGLLKNSRQKQEELLNTSPNLQFVQITCLNNIITKSPILY